MNPEKDESRLSNKKYSVQIQLDLKDGGIHVGTKQCRPSMLLPGDMVIFQVVPGPGLTDCSIQSLLVFEQNTAMPKLQKGALVATWSLLKNTAGVTTTLSGIYLTIPTTNRVDEVTVVNTNVSGVGQTCFVTMVGLVSIGEKVGTWVLDPELILQSGGG